ncbi:bisanhydrobacterioruberin hydratase [Halanaeroarchaeum sulfurireducens]|uniref:bisanhydrobacterioruberin hydratase n=1 Tax=Halanaeroarchaeum sulfurireducens TaxID=1604004 RepID=UPI000679DA7F|nr:bisanhydrobacterioruberin hydratase [Halanaeroarchaeum sulfurireducens]
MGAETRRGLETRLDDFVRRNRFTIAVTFPAVGVVLLVASAEGLIPEPYAFQPTLLLFGTAVMRLPLVAAIVPLFDRRGAAIVGGLMAYAYGIEYVGITTGWPYGEFAYEIALGPMVHGIPVGLPVFFVPLVVNAYLLTVLVLGERADARLVRLPATLAVVLAIDLVLDPGAVALRFWTYGGGPIYGVPLSNYAGWVLSGTVSVVTLDAAFSRTALLERLETAEFALDDMVSFVLLWGGVNAFYGNWLATGVALTLLAGLLATDRFDVVFQGTGTANRVGRWVRGD